MPAYPPPPLHFNEEVGVEKGILNCTIISASAPELYFLALLCSTSNQYMTTFKTAVSRAYEIMRIYIENLLQNFSQLLHTQDEIVL